jgi:hypothetical protein
MSKRSLLIMSFLFVFAFGGAVSDLSFANTNTKTSSVHTPKSKKSTKRTSGKKSSKKKSSKKSSGKKSGKKKSSGKKRSSGKKSKYNKKGKSKKHGSKKSKRHSSRNRTSTTSSRSYNSGTYTPPKSYDLNSGDNSSREYKRSESSEPKETFKKEPKKDGE